MSVHQDEPPHTCDLFSGTLPTFSHTKTIALHTLFNLDVTNVILVKERGKDIQSLTVFSLIHNF